MIAVICILATSGNMHGQVARSMYFMDNIPQANTLNPAFTMPYNIYVGVPLISSSYVGFENSFSFNDLTRRRADDSLSIDREGFLKKLEDKNYFSFEINNELLKGGIRLKNSYFHFGISKIFNAKFAYSKDFVQFLSYGNGHQNFLGRNVAFEDNGLNLTLYHEISAGYSIEIKDKVKLGIRYKYLNGFFNIWTEESYFRIKTDAETNYAITLRSDVLLHTSSTISDFNNMIDQMNDYSWLELSDNHGNAFDFGFSFKASKKVSFAGSVIDLGSITWKENIKNYKTETANSEFIFDGFDLNDLFAGSKFNDSLTIIDSITDALGLVEDNESYTSHLNPKLYLSTSVELTEKDKFGLMMRNDFVEGTIQPSFTLGYSHKFGKFIEFMANYSAYNKSYTNLGMGIAAKFGPVLLYALNDNFYALFDPENSRNYNFHFGANIVLGRKKDEEKPDAPVDIDRGLEY